ncbi:bacterial proteasome activator family protein [Arthrobacter woluwensis]|uniref:bacterial proteasome activator family protein n=1 Tax=Arthrobacter woluwensis TaxID=156980 RepID=UPI0015E73A5D|nr:bacterial proteasome activator family protein [Arthrobacter woluwensis]
MSEEPKPQESAAAAGQHDPVEGRPVEGRPVEGTPVDGPEETREPGSQDPRVQQEPRAQQGPGGEGDRRPRNMLELVDEPAKVMRIGTMIRQLLEEVKAAPLDDAARGRLAEIHERSIEELEDGLAPELVEELERISLPFPENSAPSDAELRIAQAQLVGWLEGLFHGIQTAIAAQQAAREQMAAQLRQLPPGTMVAPGVVIGANGEPQRAPAAHQQNPRHGGREEPDSGLGQYL